MMIYKKKNLEHVQRNGNCYIVICVKNSGSKTIAFTYMRNLIERAY